MKNVTYSMILLIALVFLSNSCKKDENTTQTTQPVKTLAQQYPMWSSATWVSTTVNGVAAQYPQLNFSIVDNTCTINEIGVDDNVLLPFTCTTITLVSSNEIEFGNIGHEFTFTADTITKVITCNYTSNPSTVYTLKY